MQLADILRAHIADGRWAPNDALPSEAELCAIYDLSRTAVRQALGELVVEGLVQKEKGRGTFVSRPKVAEFVVQELRGFFDEMSERGQLVHTRILRQELATVPPSVAPQLRVRMGSEVVLLERVRSINGEPIVQVRTSLPSPRFAALVDMDMREQTLYGVLAEHFGIEPHSGRRRFEAVAADDELALHLDVEPGAPILKLTALNIDQHGAPFEHFAAWYRGDRSSFEVLIESQHVAADRLADVLVGT